MRPLCPWCEGASARRRIGCMPALPVASAAVSAAEVPMPLLGAGSSARTGPRRAARRLGYGARRAARVG
eukprot:590289-Prymnesium_polylepis.2